MPSEMLDDDLLLDEVDEVDEVDVTDGTDGSDQDEPGRLRALVARIKLAPARPEETPAQRRARYRRTSGLGLLTLGLCLLLFLAYLFAFTGLQQQRKQRELLNVFTTPAGAVPLSGAVPAAGQPAAILTIPALHLHQVVVQGTTPSDLAAGPGVMPATARPGTKGNSVIAGRRYTSGAPFGHLNELRPGNHLLLITGLGRFHYVVVSKPHIAVPGNLDPVSPKHRAQLTLITAASVSGSSRLFVVAHLISAPAASKRATHPPTATELGLAGDPSAVGPTIIWGAILALVLLASFIAYGRARRQIVAVYVLTTPIILAVALMFYAQLYQLLPSTV